MSKTRNTTLALAAVVLFCLPPTAQADGDWRDAWLANYVDICPDLVTAAQNCFLCHTSVPALNPYGADMSNMNFSAIEGTDSDGDGNTNGQEILIDCTLPGDSGSVPEGANSWGAVKALFR